MKKNIVIAILSIVSVASLIYGYNQKQRADEQEAIAIEQTNIAREVTLQAERQKANIQAANDDAALQVKLAEEALKKSTK